MFGLTYRNSLYDERLFYSESFYLNMIQISGLVLNLHITTLKVQENILNDYKPVNDVISS